MSNSMMKEAALKYAEHGFSVFPLNGKIPAIKGGHGHQDASSDETQIASWFDDGDYQHCNIGLAIPDNIWVLDVDIRPDIDGSKSLASLTEQHGELPPTVTQITGSGGRHLLFKRNGADFGCSGSRIGPGLDVKTKDGYVVVAPSIHPYTGNAYRWEDGKAPWECEIVEAPEWLEQLAVKPEYETPIIQQMDSDHATSVPEAYGKAALADECQKILNAANGTQQQTLNEASFKIGTLVGAGALDQFEASNTLIEAGCSMQSFKSTNRWAPQNVKKIVDQGLADGMKRKSVV